MQMQKKYKEWCDLAKSKSRIRDVGGKRALFMSQLAKLWDIGAKDEDGVATIRENRLLTVSDKEKDIAFYADQQGMREAVMSGKDKICLQRSCFCCSDVVVAHIYPPVSGQRQTLIYWTICTLFITRTQARRQRGGGGGGRGAMPPRFSFLPPGFISCPPHGIFLGGRRCFFWPEKTLKFVISVRKSLRISATTFFFFFFFFWRSPAFGRKETLKFRPEKAFGNRRKPLAPKAGDAPARTTL